MLKHMFLCYNNLIRALAIIDLLIGAKSIYLYFIWRVFHVITAP